MNSQRYENILKQMKPGSFVHRTLSEEGQRRAAEIADILNKRSEESRRIAQEAADAAYVREKQLHKQRETPLEVARVYMGCHACRAQFEQPFRNNTVIIDEEKLA